VSYTVYILECVNGAYYTGFTTDLERRYQEHSTGSAKSKFTRSFPPIRIAAHWIFNDKSTALSIEQKIKRCSRAKKQQLIDNPNHLKDLIMC
jgi:putative endonuclease